MAFGADDKAFEDSAKDLDDKAFENSAKYLDDKAFEDSAKDLDDKAFEDSAKDLNDGEGFGDVAKDVNDGAPYSDEPLGKGNILVRLGIRSRKISPSQLCIGDHITSDRGKHTYHHHGIFLGNDRVAHFTRTSRSGTKYKCYHGRDTDKLPVSTDNTTELRLTCLKCFMRGHHLYRYDHDRGFSAVLTGGCTRPSSEPEVDKVLERAWDLLRSGKWQRYNLLYNNCETFAYYCKTGTFRSTQAANGMLKLASLGCHGD